MKRICLGVLVLLYGTGSLGGAIASTGSAHQGFPVVGCDDLSKPYANHYGWRYAPTNFCGFKRGPGVEGIDHTKWQGWGNAQATGRGYILVYDRSFALFPVSLTRVPRTRSGLSSCGTSSPGPDTPGATTRPANAHGPSPCWLPERTHRLTLTSTRTSQCKTD